MSAIPAPRSFMQELVAGHVLAMQCGGRADAFLDRAAAGPAGRHSRSDHEAVRMGALFSRLVENVGRGLALTRAGRVPPVAADLRLVLGPASGRTRGSARAELSSAPTISMPKLHAAPGASRGRLKNGNPSGDYLRAPRCGACTRAGCPCRQPAMKNGRCRLHGGLSTGPRTAAGRRRSQTARLTHGYRSAELIGLRTRAVHAARRLRALNAVARSAGHGVDRSDSKSVGASGARPLSRPRSAGHGVDCPIAVNRGDAEAQRVRRGGVFEPLPARAARNQISSAPLRLCGESSAGHGVDRPESIRRVAAAR
jgi:hypothetical protein